MQSCRFVLCWIVLFAASVFISKAQQTFFSRQSGAWSAPASWSNVSHVGAPASGLPTALDDVVIGNGHIIGLDQTTSISSLTILNGTLEYDNVMARELTIGGLLRIEAAGIFTVRTMGAGVANALILQGSVVNNGIWTMRPVPNSSSFRAVTAFASTGLQTITGNPVLTRLNQVFINKGSRSAVIDCSISLGVGIPSNTLLLQTLDYFTSTFGVAGGTWRQSAGTITFDDGITNSSGQRIETPGALHITGSANMIFGQNGFGASLTLDGGELLFNTSSSAPSRIGLTAGNSLLYTGSVDRSSFVLQQGVVEVSGRFSRNNPMNIISYVQSGGTLILAAAGSPNIASRGVFEVVNAASEFSMSGGTILLRNANASASLTRPADFFIGLGANAQFAAVSPPSALVQFADAGSLANQRFDFDVPQSLVWGNITIGNTSARLHPANAAQNLRFAGNFTVNGAFDGTQNRFSTPTASILTLQGQNSVNQTISGTSTVTAQNLVLNRQSLGSGIATASLPMRVVGTLDLQEGTNPNPQVLELGVNADLTVQNTSAAAILDAAETRSLRTSRTGGRLQRALTGNGDYLFPVSSAGSSLNGSFTYTPLLMRVSGASGQVSTKVYSGANTAQTGAHRQIPASAQSYARRVWRLETSGVSGSAQIIPILPSSFADVAGSKAGLSLARYRPNEDVSGSAWFYTDSLTLQNASAWEGDWALIEGLSRTFYSRTSGFWANAATWSLESHTGAAVPQGISPNLPTDTAVVGGGVNGAQNHIVSLASPVNIGGTFVGKGFASAGQANTGTLELLGENILQGSVFELGERSTLRIGAALGIRALPVGEGNIQTRTERRFAANARYDYIGTVNQVPGDGLPQNVLDLSVAKPPQTTLLLDKNITIWNSLTVESGVLDAQNFLLQNSTNAGVNTRQFSLGSAGVLRIGGTNGFADASTGTVRGFLSYSIDERSTVELYGGNQVLEPIPGNVAFGNVIVSGLGTKTVSRPLTVRRDLTVQNRATLLNNSHGAGLQVLGNVRNEAVLRNNGVLEIGR